MPNFSVEQVNQISANQSSALANINIPDGTTLLQYLTNIVSSSPAANSVEEKLKNILDSSGTSIKAILDVRIFI